MSPGPNDRLSAPGTVDRRLQDAGINLMTRLAAALRIGRTYTAENQVFRQQIEAVQAVLAPILAESGEAVLVALDTDFYLNGVRLPVKTQTLKLQSNILDEFKRRKIVGLRVEAGIQEEELVTFFRLFMQPDAYAGPALLEACLAQGLMHIAPAIHASTEEPAGGSSASPLDWIGDAFGSEPEAEGSSGGGGGGHGGNGGGGGVGPALGLGGRGTGNAPRGASRKYYGQAMQGARSLLTTTTLQNGLEMRHGKRVVQPLVDAAFADEPAVVGLSSLTHKDEYTYAHAVNVCLIAVTMGKLLEMDRRALADLGVAALLHDVGKAAVGEEITNPLEAFTEAERAACERHPLEGALLLARTTKLNQSTLRCMRVSLEHHMALDQTGYPMPAGPWIRSVMSRLVSVADCYVSMIGHRSERGALTTPYEALGKLLGPYRKRFDPAMLWALVQSVGFYPPGQVVLLNDGSIATVLAPNPDDLARPHLQVTVNIIGEPVPQDEGNQLRPLPPTMNVVRALRAEEYPKLTDAEAA